MSVIGKYISKMEDHRLYGIRFTEEDSEKGFECFDEIHSGAGWKKDYEANKNSPFFEAALNNEDGHFQSGRVTFFVIEDMQID